MTAKGTEARVCADITKRQQSGIAKYGTTVAENPLGLVQWLQHAYEETLDQAVYLKRSIEQLQGVPAELALPTIAPEIAPDNPDPHAELRKTWRPGQRWQLNIVGDEWADMPFGTEPSWGDVHGYRRHPDDKDGSAS